MRSAMPRGSWPDAGSAATRCSRPRGPQRRPRRSPRRRIASSTSLAALSPRLLPQCARVWAGGRSWRLAGAGSSMRQRGSPAPTGSPAPRCRPPRRALALGAILAGYAVGAAGFALHHTLGQTLVRVTGAPHAKAYAVLLPHTLGAMVDRAPRELTALAEALGAEPTPEATPRRVAELAVRSGVTRLSEIGVDEDAFDEVVEQTIERPDLSNTPRRPDAAELRGLLERAI